MAARLTLLAFAIAGLLACSAPAAAPSASPSAAASSSPSVSPSVSAGPTAVNSGPAIAVLGTENFYADLLAQIGGPRVTASSILNDPNVDPHEYEASPAAAKQVADAKLVIVNGIGYDDWMDKLIEASPRSDRAVINVQDLLGVKDDVNVHVWYDPTTMPKVADAAATALTKLDPQNGAYFAAQKAKYLASHKAVTDKIVALKAKYDGAPIAFTENVAGYLTDAIGLKVLTPDGFMEAIEAGTDPAPADVAAERNLITGKKVKVLVYNSQVRSQITQQIHDLAEQSGVPIVGVAETIPPQFKTFQEWQLAQLNELESALAK